MFSLFLIKCFWKRVIFNSKQYVVDYTNQVTILRTAEMFSWFSCTSRRRGRVRNVTQNFTHFSYSFGRTGQKSIIGAFRLLGRPNKTTLRFKSLKDQIASLLKALSSKSSKDASNSINKKAKSSLSAPTFPTQKIFCVSNHCEDCRLTFVSANSFNNHMKTIHGTTKT